MVNQFVTQDILNRVNDLVQNYTTGSIDLGNRMRAINSAIEYVKKRMTLPSDEQIQRLYFTEDVMYYDVNEDFTEGLGVFYDDSTKNFASREWNYAPYMDILRLSGRQYPNSNWWSWTAINGQMQLLLFGRNLNDGALVNSFDQLGNSPNIFTGQNNAQNLHIDNNIYTQGSGSLAFDINPLLGGSGMGSIYWPTNYDFTTVLQDNGYFKMYVWLPTAAVSSINLTLFTSPTSYFGLSATTFADGTAFSTSLNNWKLVQWNFLNNVVAGSPLINNITAMRLDVDQGAGFGTSVVPNFRFDKLYTQIPDYLDLVYLSAYKGTDSTGATNKIFLTDPADIPSIASVIPDFIDPIAYRAAMILVPQLMSNEAFRQAYKEEMTDVMAVYGRQWPRKRVLNMGKLVLSRPRP